MVKRFFVVSETRLWLAVALWIVTLFFTIPIARALQGVVRESLGSSSFGYFVITVVIFSTVVVLYKIRERLSLKSSSFWWLLVCATVLIAYTIRLWDNPVEAVHFVQYGILTILAFLALGCRHKNSWVYLAAFLVTVIVGIIDEGIQWLVPNRIWGLSDIGINSLSALIMCLAIAFGIKPKGYSNQALSSTKVLVCNLAIVSLLLIFFSLANTPNIIKWYGEKIDALNYLVDNGQVMTEYGYLYEDNEIGVFRSRYNANALILEDQLRASEAAEKLDLAAEPEDYLEFIRRYSPITDPFLHELRVHLNRRDYYLLTGQRIQRYEQKELLRRLRIAWYENRIVEKYFPQTLAQSSFTLSPNEREIAQKGETLNNLYVSPVSKALITRVSKTVLLIGVSILILFILLLRWRFKKGEIRVSV